MSQEFFSSSGPSRPVHHHKGQCKGDPWSSSLKASGPDKSNSEGQGDPGPRAVEGGGEWRMEV